MIGAKKVGNYINGNEKYKKAVAKILESISNNKQAMNDIAKLMHVLYGTEYICSSISNKTWYQFKNHHWEEIEGGIFLREKISKEIVSLPMYPELLSTDVARVIEAVNSYRSKSASV